MLLYDVSITLIWFNQPNDPQYTHNDLIVCVCAIWWWSWWFQSSILLQDFFSFYCRLHLQWHRCVFYIQKHSWYRDVIIINVAMTNKGHVSVFFVVVIDNEWMNENDSFFLCYSKHIHTHKHHAYLILELFQFLFWWWVMTISQFRIFLFPIYLFFF